jgi:cell division protease FtsH
MEKLISKMNKLKQQKRRFLENTRGLKLSPPPAAGKLLEEIMNGDDEYDDEYDEEDDELEATAGGRIVISPIGGGIPAGLEELFGGGGGSARRQTGVRIFKRADQKPAGEESKSENFEVIKTNMTFAEIGGHENIKRELMQCADLLVNFEKYAKFNVRTPKGLILEGPPGNGKTLLAKCFSGEINVSFIPVSGAQFQEKYVGVGASRIRELFELAAKNAPCIVFIDEIDALGRKRTNDEESSNAERDSTLNELLVALDGFKTTPGVFLLASTNRVDLLDSALTRPGRIDKSIFVGNPDAKTRDAILRIHSAGKPMSAAITMEQLTEMTRGCSGAQIENLLNEAMLLAIREGREEITMADVEFIMARVLVGFQSSENTFTEEMLYHIAIHEMGHACVGMQAENYRRVLKVSLNTWSPKNPGYTLFESEESGAELHTKQSLMSHLMVLLGGRVAEEIFFHSVSTGASHDLEQARKLAEEMVVNYGMGNKLIYPQSSNKFRETVDHEIDLLIETAYLKTKVILANSRAFVENCARELVKTHVLTRDELEAAAAKN